jgi:hypothetical protein
MGIAVLGARTTAQLECGQATVLDFVTNDFGADPHDLRDFGERTLGIFGSLSVAV